MKKAMLSILFICIFRVLPAPGFDCGMIAEGERIIPFDPMLYAFMKIESNFDTDTVNSLGYGGILQLGQEMIDEANRINELKGNPQRFVLSDRLDSAKSVRAWYTVQDYWNPPYSLKKACKVWNPLASGKYHDKIRKQMRIL